jgi:hypothetical protein
MRLWRTYIKDTEAPFSKEPAPYYWQWGVWCWQKPIYIGLPLIPLSIVVMAVDALFALIWLFTHWGKKEG